MEKPARATCENGHRDGRKVQAGMHFREMVPRGGLQESRISKGLARGGTLKPLPASLSFTHYGVPLIREGLTP
jgi:hypothetical protein